MTSEQLLALADNLACSLESIIQAQHQEDIDWPGTERDLRRYWEARAGHTEPELPFDEPIDGQAAQDVTTGEYF